MNSSLVLFPIKAPRTENQEKIVQLYCKQRASRITITIISVEWKKIEQNILQLFEFIIQNKSLVVFKLFIFISQTFLFSIYD